MEKDRWKAVFQPGNKKMRSNIFLILMLGILLLLAGRSFSDSKENPEVQPQQATKESTDKEMERRMAEILSKVEGAGEVDVMLTYQTTEEKNYSEK